MNILIKSASDSGESSERVCDQLEPLLQKLSIKTLRSAENVLQQSLISAIQKKYSEYSDQSLNIVNFLEFFIFSLINQVDKLQQVVSIDILKEDYETLENAVQKSQAEIRKHIRIEQQLKIYLDSLQEKNEELERKLEVEENKYAQLFEVRLPVSQTMREIEEERKDLQRKMMKMQDDRDKSKLNSNYTTINEQSYKEYIVGRRSKGSKNKNVIEKFNDRARKMSEKRSDNKNTHFIEGAIQINLSNNIVVSKKNSFDQNLNRAHPISNDSSIRQLTKTVQMKQPHVSSYDKKPNRKISKYKTETAEEAQRKEVRSNSVCN